MKKEEEGRIKIGNGFKFRITQFILYLLAFVGFVIGCVVWYLQFNYGKSFMGWIENNYYYGSYEVDLNGDGSFDKNDGEIHARYYENEKYLTVGSGNNSVKYMFVSEDMGAKQFTFSNEKTGNSLTVKFSQVRAYNDFVSSRGWLDEYGSFEVTFYVFVGLAAFFGIFAVLQALSAFLGKKSVKANNLGIVVNSIMIGYGVFGLVGGVKGRMYLQFTKLYGQSGLPAIASLPSESVQPSDNGGVQETIFSETQSFAKENALPQDCEPSAVAEPVREEEEVEYIQPKMGAKGRKAITIAAIISYAALLILGILFAAVPAMGNILSGIGICEAASARAYGITIGVMWVALVPTVGYIFVTVAPTELGVKGKILIAAISTALLVAMNVIFFVIINAVKLELNVDLLTEKNGEKLLELALSKGNLSVKNYFEGDDSWFIPVSMVFASIAFVICHALMLFKINPDKIKTEKPRKTGDGFGATLKYLLSFIAVFLLKIAKSILKFKEKFPEVFILAVTVLLTWLVYFVSFIFSIICIAVFISVIAMYFIGIISWAYTPSSGSEETITIDGKPVTEQPYVIDDRYQRVYKDKYGNEYVSDDGGKTARKYHRYDE